jgi:hypothetical protein
MENIGSKMSEGIGARISAPPRYAKEEEDEWVEKGPDTAKQLGRATACASAVLVGWRDSWMELRQHWISTTRRWA